MLEHCFVRSFCYIDLSRTVAGMANKTYICQALRLMGGVICFSKDKTDIASVESIFFF